MEIASKLVLIFKNAFLKWKFRFHLRKWKSFKKEKVASLLLDTYFLEDVSFLLRRIFNKVRRKYPRMQKLSQSQAGRLVSNWTNLQNVLTALYMASCNQFWPCHQKFHQLQK